MRPSYTSVNHTAREAASRATAIGTLKGCGVGHSAKPSVSFAGTEFPPHWSMRSRAWEDMHQMRLLPRRGSAASVPWGKDADTPAGPCQPTSPTDFLLATSQSATRPVPYSSIQMLCHRTTGGEDRCTYPRLGPCTTRRRRAGPMAATLMLCVPSAGGIRITTLLAKWEGIPRIGPLSTITSGHI
jgi:hypothetical protein